MAANGKKNGNGGSGGNGGKAKAEEKPLGMVMLPGCRCRCGHEWLPRGDERPAVCPKCKSPRWDKPKKWERKSE